MTTKVSGDAVTRRPTYAGADLLDGRHQRERQKHRPADREAELCSRETLQTSFNAKRH